LRGLSLTAGEPAWSIELGTAEPIDPPDEMVGLVDEGSFGWTWHVASSGLTLIRFEAAPNQLVIQSLDPRDGNVSGEITTPLKGVSGDFYSVPQIIAWDGDLVYLSLDGMLYCINIQTGEILFHFQ
jgi:hypothetical protein